MSRRSTPTVTSTATTTPEPLLIGAAAAAALCARSEASWWRDHAAKRTPAPLRLGGRTLWRVAELRAWIGAGCPSRATWEAMQAATSRR